VINKKHVLVCTWSPNEKWKSLSTSEKRTFLDSVARNAIIAKEGGMDILGWGALNHEISNPAPKQFCGVFAVSNEDHLFAIDEAIGLSGWYDYFDHVNVGTELRGQDGTEATDVLCDLLEVL
jgi:hypothetical protein